jgi:hypothetical protein
MSDRPTPETDAEFPKLYDSATEWVDADFARRLERERDDLLSRLTAIEHRMPEELARLEHQRDRLAESVERIDYCLSNAENVMHGAGSDDITIARRIIIDALAAVKGDQP